MANDKIEQDNVQHGIDDNPHGDAGKGALLGGLGGAAVGALAGGPVGAVVGAIAGAIASGAGVAAVDAVDNDNTVTGVGDGATHRDASVTNTGYSDNEYSNQPSIAERLLAGTTNVESEATSASYAADANYATPNANTTADLHASSLTNDLADSDTIRVPVVEEELNVQKHSHQAGEVQVRKEVITEQVNIPVEITREEVVITRHAVDRNLAPGETTLGEEVLRVPVMEETVSVTKTPHVVEEIEIGKQRVTEHQTVSDTVHKERIDVDDSTVSATQTRNTTL